MTVMHKLSCTLTLLLLLCQTGLRGQTHFANPLLPSGADPWAIYKNGYYYYTHTTGRSLVLYKTKNLSDLKNATRKVVWTPPDSTAYSEHIWAPELHYIRHKWYFYFAADDGHNRNHRMYVLENRSADPLQGEWVFKGKVADLSDKWAIDGSVFKHRGRRYMIWSGWEGDRNGQQDIYIARMGKPWQIRGRRVRISSPVHDWERHGDLNDPDGLRHVAVNEGPQALHNGKRLFIVYSASGCWTDHYSLGLLTFTGRRNLLDSAAWKKEAQPVFSASARDSVFAPGHNSFFTSPNGKEDWILYHANSQPGQGCGRMRSPRAQRFTWKEDGSPYFGAPVKPGALLEAPSRKERKELLRNR